MKEKDSKKTGTFYGVGVGPGDPELLTLKALRILKAAPSIAVPKSMEQRKSLALTVVEKAVGLEGKEVFELLLPMTRDNETLVSARQEAAKEIIERLSAGKDVAFITVGDPLFYSTFSYFVPLVTEGMAGVRVEVIPGVTSVSAAASSAGMPVAKADERVIIVPSIKNTKEIRVLLRGFHTVVLMKISNFMDEILDTIEELGLTESSVFVSRAGWPDQEVVKDIRRLKGKKVDYFSMIIVRPVKEE